MTLIPADTKDLKGQPVAEPTGEPSNYQEPLIPPPAYSETDESISVVARSVETPGYKPPPAPPEKIPQSNAINASKSVNLEGPLHILGAAKSSAGVTLSNNITVEGKVSSSASILLEGGVVVNGKVDASGSVKLRNGVSVLEKVDASGSIE
jgi:phage baseplate assembly protein gpV